MDRKMRNYRVRLQIWRNGNYGRYNVYQRATSPKEAMEQAVERIRVEQGLEVTALRAVPL